MRTTTIGKTRCGGASSSMRRPTCSPTAWRVRHHRDRQGTQEEKAHFGAARHPRHGLYRKGGARGRADAALVRGGQPEQARLCRGHARGVCGARPGARAAHGPGARGPLSCGQPARHAALQIGARPRGGAAVHARGAPDVRGHGRRARHRGGALFGHPQPRLLRRLHFCALAFHQAGWSRAAATRA